MRGAVLAGAFMLAVVAKPAHGEAIDVPAIGYAVDAATPYFQLRQFEAGWSGLQDEVTACYRALPGWKMRSKAAFCIALDEYAVMDTELFPASLRPAFFSRLSFERRSRRAMAPLQDPRPAPKARGHSPFPGRVALAHTCPSSRDCGP